MKRPFRNTTPLTAEQQQLAAGCYHLALKLAKPFKQSHPHLADDIESAALYALVTAARGYTKPELAKFTTFAGRAVVHEIRSTLGRLVKPKGFRKASKSGTPPSTGRLADASEVTSRGASPEDALARAESDAAFEARLRKLRPADAELCRLRYRDGLTLRQVAEGQGCTKQNVDQSMRRVLGALKRENPAP